MTLELKSFKCNLITNYDEIRLSSSIGKLDFAFDMMRCQRTTLSQPERSKAKYSTGYQFTCGSHKNSIQTQDMNNIDSLLHTKQSNRNNDTLCDRMHGNDILLCDFTFGYCI